MNQNKTASILQRVPRILAVTAASYGLSKVERERAGRTARPDKSGDRPQASQGAREARH
ncbi:hypothetical protein [Ramlibacter sp.]|uniref:hypothetical protein n=1 Tax=Ramlibacter sp. TaxID=1917967 RepID=UPI003D11B933